MVFIEIGRRFTLETLQTYLEFHRTIEVDWSSNGNVGWCTYSAGDGIVSDIPARWIPRHKRSLGDEEISIHIITVWVYFLVDYFFPLAAAH